jgi:hypothetical protein
LAATTANSPGVVMVPVAAATSNVSSMLRARAAAARSSASDTPTVTPAVSRRCQRRGAASAARQARHTSVQRSRVSTGTRARMFATSACGSDANDAGASAASAGAAALRSGAPRSSLSSSRSRLSPQREALRRTGQRKQPNIRKLEAWDAAVR